MIKVKKEVILMMIRCCKNTLLSAVIILGLTACDNELFNELFRNPYIIEVIELDTINANEWYEFETDAEALHSIQEIEIVFKGCEPGILDASLVGHDENYEGGRVVYTSKAFPGYEVIFDVQVFDSDAVEYNFPPIGMSSGITLRYDDALIIKGKTIKTIRLKANLDHEDIKVTWISRTGK